MTHRSRPGSLLVAIAIVAITTSGCSLPFSPRGADRPTPATVDRSPGCESTRGAETVEGDVRIQRYSVTVVPLVGAEADATTAARLLERESSVGVDVTAPVSLPDDACTSGGQVQLERITDFVPTLYEASRLQAVIVVTVDDLRSDTYDWQFGGWNPGHHLGVVSTARFHQFRGKRPIAQARRQRIGALALKYLLLLRFEAPEVEEVGGSSLLAYKYSFEHLDAATLDLCPYRDVARWDPDLLRCP